MLYNVYRIRDQKLIGTYSARRAVNSSRYRYMYKFSKNTCKQIFRDYYGKDINFRNKLYSVIDYVVIENVESGFKNVQAIYRDGTFIH